MTDEEAQTDHAAGAATVDEDASTDERAIEAREKQASPVPGQPMVAPPRRTGIFVDPVDLRAHVGELLRVTLGGYEVDQNGNFTFLHQGARVFVTINMSQVGPQVGVFSITNIGLDLSPELGQFLLTTNHKLGFGAFSYDADNAAVWLRHSLLGTTLDAPELQSSVVTIAAAAAHFDDIIQQQFGGRRFEQASSDEQRDTQPPTSPEDPPPATPNASGYL